MAIETQSAFDPKPIVKWAGGKTKLLSKLLALVPEKFGHYYEPFIGGGALFFALVAAGRLKPSLSMAGEVATLVDNNAELVNLYKVVRDIPTHLIRALDDRYGDTGKRVYEYSKDQYYKHRAVDPSSLGTVSRAARFMYLNRTCFNGLYRVNKAGRFNVPMGSYKNPTICDAKAIHAASRALQGVMIHHGDFCEHPERDPFRRPPRHGDVFYFDPPYDPVSVDSDFTSYTAEKFAWEDQVRLRQHAEVLAQRGVRVIASNADTKRIRELWKGFQMLEVKAPRAINSRTEKRGDVSELIFHNLLKT